MVEFDPKKLPVDSSETLPNFYCKIKIREVEFFPQNIGSLIIKQSVFDIVPRIQLDFISDEGRFIDKYPITNGDIIELQLAKHRDLDDLINTKFIVHDYISDSITRLGNVSHSMTITGYLDINNFYNPIKNRVFKTSKTSEIVKKISSECSLDANIKINTNDKQNWYQSDLTNKDFLNKIINNSYYKDKDSVFWYIDKDLNFNLTTLETERENETKNLINDTFESTQLQKPSDIDQENVLYNNIKYLNLSGTYNNNWANGSDLNYWNMEKNVEKSINFSNIKFSDIDTRKNLNNTVRHDTYSMLTDNHHSNFHVANSLNNYIKSNLLSKTVLVSVNAVYDIKLFDVMNLVVMSTDGNGIDIVNSGKHFVTAIMYSISSEGLTQKLMLNREGENEPDFDI